MSLVNHFKHYTKVPGIFRTLKKKSYRDSSCDYVISLAKYSNNGVSWHKRNQAAAMSVS